MGVPGRGAADFGRHRRGAAACDQRARGEVVRRAKPADAADAASRTGGRRDAGGGVCRERGRPGRPDRQGLRHADVGVPGDLCIAADDLGRVAAVAAAGGHRRRSEEHTSELQSLMRISYAVFFLKKKKHKKEKEEQKELQKKHKKQKKTKDKQPSKRK